ncbi:FHA domain-containing protein [Nocardia panacis]|uniref:FHA domain-containing protein n=1 Tax=Nocardia panacis TaxID=2340916 RepID=A0A3A4KKQ2_9NOCA|nr:FHA domain-containing protein [Nocardia panacis]RJO69839.1 FHA domain-containing protein [Nocardia panacis]
MRSKISVAIAAGEGLIARFGEVVVYLAEETASTDRILGAVEAVAEDRHAGAAIAQRLAAVVFGTGSEPPPFGVVAPTADGTLILLRGPVSAVIEGAEGMRRLTGARAFTWVDEIVREPVRRITVGADTGTPTRAHPRSDLHSGVVPGSGFVLETVRRTKKPAGAEPARPTTGFLTPPTGPATAHTGFPAEPAADANPAIPQPARPTPPNRPYIPVGFQPQPEQHPGFTRPGFTNGRPGEPSLGHPFPTPGFTTDPSRGPTTRFGQPVPRTPEYTPPPPWPSPVAEFDATTQYRPQQPLSAQAPAEPEAPLRPYTAAQHYPPGFTGAAPDDTPATAGLETAVHNSGPVAQHRPAETTPESKGHTANGQSSAEAAINWPKTTRYGAADLADATNSTATADRPEAMPGTPDTAGHSETPGQEFDPTPYVQGVIGAHHDGVSGWAATPYSHSEALGQPSAMDDWANGVVGPDATAQDATNSEQPSSNQPSGPETGRHDPVEWPYPATGSTAADWSSDITVHSGIEQPANARTEAIGRPRAAVEREPRPDLDTQGRPEDAPDRIDTGDQPATAPWAADEVWSGELPEFTESSEPAAATASPSAAITFDVDNRFGDESHSAPVDIAKTSTPQPVEHIDTKDQPATAPWDAAADSAAQEAVHANDATVRSTRPEHISGPNPIGPTEAPSGAMRYGMPMYGRAAEPTLIDRSPQAGPAANRILPPPNYPAQDSRAHSWPPHNTAPPPLEPVALHPFPPPDEGRTRIMRPAAGIGSGSNGPGTLVMHDGSVHPLDRPYVIGRGPQSDDLVKKASAAPLVLPRDRHVSRVHAYITVDRGKVYVRDAGTRSGTFIAASAVDQWTRITGDPTELPPGWLIRISNRVMTFRPGD